METPGKSLSVILKIGKVTLVTFLFFLAWLIVMAIVSFQGQNDTIATLGDGKFELGKFSTHLALEDHRFDDDKLRIIVSDIEKYILKGDTIYSVGDYANSMVSKDGINWYYDEYLDLRTGEYNPYQEGEPVPRYLILNTKTAELRKYVEWNEIPEEDQRIFER
ncbi:hypothetical protein COY07_06050, partial [Candidatus Peregrinibacteria bacterium CG_4_10_14_0_2_um_filter_43_11]